MNGPGRFQRGASLWMVLLFVVVLGFGAIFGLKLVPVYLEWWKVERSVEGALQGGVGSQSIKEVKQAVLRRLDIDEVRTITHRNLNEFMTVTKRGERVTIAIDYDRIEPLFGNVSILAHFEKTLTN